MSEIENLTGSIATTTGAGGQGGRARLNRDFIKVVVGIDPQQPFDVLMQTLQAFSPRSVSIHLVHAFDPEPIGNASARGQRAEQTLSGVRAALETSGLGAAWIERTSDPVEALIDVATAENADLIAIGPPCQSGGHVADRLLKRSPVSILVARTVPRKPEEVKAVLATDHSKFTNECIQRLLRMNPEGIREMVVLTANQVVGTAAAMAVHGLPDLADKAEEWISEKLTQENQHVCDLLVPLGAVCRPVVRKGYANEAIAQTMADSEADLLILGAHQHSVLQRFAFGSVSAEEVLHAPYSVLALRP